MQGQYQTDASRDVEQVTERENFNLWKSVTNAQTYCQHELHFMTDKSLNRLHEHSMGQYYSVPVLTVP